jgi:NitT/TauT family transport system permease protein
MLAPWTIVGYAVPAAATILFMILVLGINERSTTIALVMAIAPFLVNIIYQGVRSADARLFEMGRVFRVGRWHRLKHILIPQVLPSVLTAARFGFATTWKIVLIIEVFASQDGIGQRLEFFYARLRPDRLLAWTLSFAGVMLIIERLGYTSLERRIFRWRKSANVAVERRPEALAG